MRVTCVSLLLLALSICDAKKALIFRVKNEVVEKDGQNNIIKLDFEAGGRAEVTWCRILTSNPEECIPVTGKSEGYEEKDKMSLFYFIYVGSTTLRKMNDEDVLAYKVTVRMKNGEYIYSHLITMPDAEVAQAHKRNLETAKIIEAPEPITFTTGETVYEKCKVESKEPMVVRWYYLPRDSSAPVLLYTGTDGTQGRLKVAAHVQQIAGSLRENTELEVPDAQAADAGVYMCEFTSRITGDTTQLFGSVRKV